MEKYLVVIEKADSNYSAFSPDLPGCITVGATVEETISHMKEAIELYLEVTVEQGEGIPPSRGLRYHIDEGVFNENEIAPEYYIAQVEVHSPEIAA
ncbi:MAG: type II toxin-antitoxin system HicB family antitoxin [Flavisolibacter sp.]|nr:type II toxin-antitoxin system HicB family antitoxin [Flavisolibacter sp.]